MNYLRFELEGEQFGFAQVFMNIIWGLKPGQAIDLDPRIMSTGYTYNEERSLLFARPPTRQELRQWADKL